jgi:type IV pilus assembly protein PilX
MTSTKNQRGFVLATSLVLLSVLSLLAIIAVRTTLFEERMTASDRDLAIARENAELALRDAEKDILGLRFDGLPNFCAGTPAPSPGCGTLRTAGTRPISATDALTFWTMSNDAIDDVGLSDGGASLGVAQQGVYNSQSAADCGKPIWSGANWNDGVMRTCGGAGATITGTVPTVAYGTFTGAVFPPANAQANIMTGIPAPRYLIELFNAQQMTLAQTSNKLFFRITAVGFGRTIGSNGARTSITLQSVFSPV